MLAYTSQAASILFYFKFFLYCNNLYIHIKLLKICKKSMALL
ncbi:hypothetical protein HMPREF3189_01112 [Clostridiales bacterium KA00134]|nr:hypothetical protein HMPREF3189_01112 [Clostridiales bacterium KA00134]